MTEDVRSLLDALRKGNFDNPDEKIALLAAALREDPATDCEFLLSLLRAPQGVVRAAALMACKGRRDADLMPALKELIEDEDSRVRKALAEMLRPLPDPLFLPALTKLCHDRDDAVRAAALRSSTDNPALMQAQLEALNSSASWTVKIEAARALASHKAPAAVPLMFDALKTESFDDVHEELADALELRINLGKGYVRSIPDNVKLLASVEKTLSELDTKRFPKLLEMIRERTHVAIDPDQLKMFGADLTAQLEKDGLPPTFGMTEHAQRLAELLTGARPRSVVLLGEPGVGKTALVHELTRLLARPEHGAWRVLRMSSADFLQGTHYIGEWETRVNQLIQTIRRPRRALLYVPNLSELSGVGKHSKGEHNVLSALLPHIDDGSITVLGESQASEYEQGFASARGAQRSFEPMLLPAADEKMTRDIASQLRDHFKCALTNEQLDQLIELGEQFVLNQGRPGNAATLLKAVHAIETKTQTPVTTRQVLEALSSSTGLPVDLLDDAVPLKLDVAREFFEKRVLGQPEAVDAVLDLVTLIKAGLADPSKPLGVFLFVGPTGVGKTELARALAEYIFGDSKRLLRFDMSEFAEAQGFERLIGARSPGLLTAAVRQNPFSVVLLDEIEKSHLNVFDLCLQIFDAGRLTDGMGRATDFRRTIVVLTSNIGATKQFASPIGFRTSEIEGVDPHAQRKEDVARELSLFFRPEFLNRIDRIVHFRPLALDIAENIARKEVAQALDRAGIRRRGLKIEVDPTAISLLVKEGYSPHFGARPLKRAVERTLLIPLARAIATGKLSLAKLVRVSANGERIQVQTLARKTEEKAEPEVSPSVEERIVNLQSSLKTVQAKAEEFQQQKERLLERTRLPEFFKDTVAAAEVYDTIHRLEQYIAFAKRVENAMARFEEPRRLARTTATQVDRQLREVQALLISGNAIAGAASGQELGDALIVLNLAARDGEAIRANEMLLRMYEGFARRHRLDFAVVAELGEEKRHTLYAHVSGLGAFVLLRGEAGLHEFQKTERSRAARTGREQTRSDSEAWRVTVFPWQEDTPREFLRGLVEKPAPAISKMRGSIEGDSTAVSLFDPKSLSSLAAKVRGKKSEALARARAILYSQLQAQDATDEAVRRRYELGIGSRIKDSKTGRVATHLDKFFKGHLELVT